MESTLIDISRVIHPEMPVYPGNPAVALARIAEASATTSALTEIRMGSHTGTHIDAPSHIDASGAGTDAYDLAVMNGPAEVVDVSQVERAVLAADLPATTRPLVLIKTKNSAGDPDVFDESFVALAESAAEELVRRGVQLVGIDALSIKRRGIKDRVHEILLTAGVVILEGLWLQQAPAGEYELLCLPLRVKNLDGAPARAVLVREG